MSTFLKKIRPLYFFLAGALLLLIFDILTKWIAQNILSQVGKSVEVIPNFLYFTLYHNTKIAFSWGIDGIGGRILNIAISLVMSIAIGIYWITHDTKFKWQERTIAMLLLSGAVGNLIDRALYWEAISGFDGVIDFVQFYLGGGPRAPQHWLNPFATFNMADAYLSVGIVALFVYVIVDSIKHGDKSMTKDPRLPEKTPESINIQENNPAAEEVAVDADKNEEPVKKEEDK